MCVTLQGLRSKLPPGSMEVLVVTGQAAVGFVIMASAMLLLLFFFLNHIFAVVLVRGPSRCLTTRV
jgi:hypothetical protein